MRMRDHHLPLVIAIAVMAIGTSCGSSDTAEISTSTQPRQAAATATPTAPGTSTTVAASSPESSTSTPQANPDRVLRVGTSVPDDPPYTRFTGTAVEGFEADLLNAIAVQMEGSVAIEWVTIERPSAFSGLGDTHDLFVDLMTNNRTRTELYAMTEPYLLAGWTALVPTSSSITEFSELSAIAVAEGTTLLAIMQDVVAASGFDIEVVSAPTPYLEVEEGRADGVAGLSVTTAEEFRAVDPPTFDLPIAMVVADAELRDEIDRALATVVTSGEWTATYETWFGAPPPFDPATMTQVPPVD